MYDVMRLSTQTEAQHPFPSTIFSRPVLRQRPLKNRASGLDRPDREETTMTRTILAVGATLLLAGAATAAEKTAHAEDCLRPTTAEIYKCEVARGNIKDPYSDWQKEAFGQKLAADRTLYLDQEDPDAGILVATLKAMKPEDRACFETSDPKQRNACLQAHGWKLVHGKIPQ
jgi:hypothetical protein